MDIILSKNDSGDFIIFEFYCKIEELRSNSQQFQKQMIYLFQILTLQNYIRKKVKIW